MSMKFGPTGPPANKASLVQVMVLTLQNKTDKLIVEASEVFQELKSNISIYTIDLKTMIASSLWSESNSGGML